MVLGRNSMPLFYVVLPGLRIFMVHVFVEYMALDLLKYTRAPGPFGDRGVCPSWLHGADGGVCRLIYAVHQTLSLGPGTVTVH